MIALISTHATRRTRTLHARLMVLQQEHVEWLATYLEWEAICRQGEDLEPEMGIARCQLEALRGQMTRVRESIRFWEKIK